MCKSAGQVETAAAQRQTKAAAIDEGGNGMCEELCEPGLETASCSTGSGLDGPVERQRWGDICDLSDNEAEEDIAPAGAREQEADIPAQMLDANCGSVCMVAVPVVFVCQYGWYQPAAQSHVAGDGQRPQPMALPTDAAWNEQYRASSGDGSWHQDSWQCDPQQQVYVNGGHDGWYQDSWQYAPQQQVHVDPWSAESLHAALQGSSSAKASAMAALQQPDVMKKHSFNRVGSPMVQYALGIATPQQATQLAAGLQGSVVKAIKDPHANHVVQKVIKEVPPASRPRFMLEEIRKEIFDLACHEFGCRVYCRLAESLKENDSDLVDFMSHLLRKPKELAQHDFGHHVVESLLEHGLRSHREHIVSALRQNLMLHMWTPSVSQKQSTKKVNFNGVHVLKKAVQCDDQELREELARALLTLSDAELIPIAAHPHKCSIISALPAMSDEILYSLKKRLGTPAALQRLAAKHCKPLLTKLGLSPGNRSATATSPAA